MTTLILKTSNKSLYRCLTLIPDIAHTEFLKHPPPRPPNHHTKFPKYSNFSNTPKANLRAKRLNLAIEGESSLGNSSFIPREQHSCLFGTCTLKFRARV